MKILMRFLLCACMAAAAADQVYRWVDKDGHVHYPQTPPAGISVHVLSEDVSALPPDPTGVKNAQDLEQQIRVQNQQAQVQA
ncbi:MAG TPA: DUF4124 domain-containing protein [Gammaproteobacteria bacterium]|nr:DUF4124 domain-containing protein [Gammaproteobacteria bacterium]